jgi:hypothetical protein
MTSVPADTTQVLSIEPERSRRGEDHLLLGRYRLGPVIGRGGMARVHRGTDVQTGQPVAIKLLVPHLAADAPSRRRLLAEARAVARLPHRHIVRLLDSGVTTDGTVVLVIELVQGESLQQRLARGPLSIAEAVCVALQVAEALEFAHRQGIIHRDVKPHNILLYSPSATPTPGQQPAATDGAPAGPLPIHAKLADFGIARSHDATGTYTATGLVMGSAAYVAPELLSGQPATPRTDIYSLGVSLFQMLTGRLPFEGATPAAALSRRLVEEAPPVRAYRADVPPWLDALVARMLRRDPAQRLADVACVAEALRAGLHAAGSPTAALPAARAAMPAITRPLTRGAQNGRADQGPAAVVAPWLRHALARTLPAAVLRRAQGSAFKVRGEGALGLQPGSLTTALRSRVGDVRRLARAAVERLGWVPAGARPPARERAGRRPAPLLAAVAAIPFVVLAIRGIAEGTLSSGARAGPAPTTTVAASTIQQPPTAVPAPTPVPTATAAPTATAIATAPVRLIQAPVRGKPDDKGERDDRDDRDDRDERRGRGRGKH